MPDWQGKRSMAIVTACRTAAGRPDFAITEVAVTQEEAENGIHYYLAEAELLEAGYEGPFFHFDQDESPAFLHPAVRSYLDRSDLSAPVLEESRCPASSK